MSQDHAARVLRQLDLMFLAAPVVLAALAFGLKKLLEWMDNRGWILYGGNPSAYGSLGHGAMDVQSLYEPHKKYVLELKAREEVRKEEDDEAGPAGPPSV